MDFFSCCSTVETQNSVVVGPRIKERLLQEYYSCLLEGLCIATATLSSQLEFGLAAGREAHHLAYSWRQRSPLHFTNEEWPADHVDGDINSLALHVSAFCGGELFRAVSMII